MKNNNIVICCDDESDIVDFLSEELSQKGYQTLKANCGNNAIEILKVQPVDAIVTDMRMPDGDGLKVLLFMKSQPGLVNIPVIFLTGFSIVSKEDLIAKGAFAVLDKPIEIEDLLKTLSKACKI